MRLGRSAVEVEVADLGTGSRVGREMLLRMARGALRKMGVPSAQVSIALVSDRKMRALNRRWRGVSRTTDVLAFPLGETEGDGGKAMLGEVVISVERARRQARAHGEPLRREVARLMIHGLLHLAGEDDSTAAKSRRMWARQEAFLKEVAPRRWTT